MKAGEQIFYLMVALLDENLDIIPGTDVMVDLNAGPGYGKYYRQWKNCWIIIVESSVICFIRVMLPIVTAVLFEWFKNGNMARVASL